MTIVRLIERLSAPYRALAYFRWDSYSQRQAHRQKLREIIDNLYFDDPKEFLLDMADDYPEKLIALGKELEKLESDSPGRPKGTTVHTCDEQIRIAEEALELKKRGKKGWKQKICEKNGISARTLERYLERARSSEID